MAENITVTNDRKLTVNVNGKSETYDLSQPIPEKALVVTREKNEILHQMDLKSVIENLDNSVDLLDVSYHAVYGFPVQSKIFALQKTLMDLNDQGILVISDFKGKAALIIQELAGIFKWLTKGCEPVAIGKLEKFAEYASGMSQQANELAESYQRMADNTSSVLQETMDISSDKYKEIDNLKTMMSDFQAQQESAAAVNESIEKRLKSLRKEYDRLSAAEERDDKQRNAMAIVGVVFSFLGRAVSVAGDAAASSGIISQTGDKESQAQLEENKKKKSEIDSELASLTTEIAQLEKSIEEKVSQKESAAEEEKKKLDTEIQTMRDSVRQKNSKKTDLSNEQKTLASTIEKLGGLVSGIGEDIKSAAPSEDLAQQRSERMKEIYDELIRLEEENTKQLGQLAEYTRKMESVVINQNSAEAAVQALIIAVSCLKRVVVAVKDIALFWNSMERCCESLANSTLLGDIKSLQELDKDTRIECYYDVDIMYPLLCYAAKWGAVYSISSNYITAAEKTRFRLNETIVSADSKDLTRENHWEKASSLAGQVSSRIEMQVAESQNKIKDFTERKNA